MNVDKYIPDTSKPKAVIFDLDGALMLGADKVNGVVKDLYDLYLEAGYRMIIFTSKDSRHDKKTIDWLNQNNFIVHQLGMREAGDKRHEWTVKKELFDRLSPNYNIRVVIEDRFTMADLWRSIELLCLQVA